MIKLNTLNKWAKFRQTGIMNTVGQRCLSACQVDGVPDLIPPRQITISSPFDLMKRSDALEKLRSGIGCQDDVEPTFVSNNSQLFHVVRISRSTGNQHHVMVKVSIPYISSKGVRTSGYENMVREIETLRDLRHAKGSRLYIPCILGSAWDDKVKLDGFRTTCLAAYAMPYLGRDAVELICSRKFGIIDLILMIEQISAAVDFLHSHRLCHADIKPENCVYSATERRWKLIDFTFSTGFDEVEMLKLCGTLPRIHPNMLSCRRPHHLRTEAFMKEIDYFASAISFMRCAGMHTCELLSSGEEHTPYDAVIYIDVVVQIQKGYISTKNNATNHYVKCAIKLLGQVANVALTVLDPQKKALRYRGARKNASLREFVVEYLAGDDTVTDYECRGSSERCHSEWFALRKSVTGYNT